MKEAREVPWSERARYRFENFLARGGVSIFVLLVLLFLVSFAGAFLLRTAILFFSPEWDLFDSFARHAYIVFLEMTDPGNMNQDIPSSPWMKIGAIVAGFLGVVIFSMLIAFITTALDSVLWTFRKGRSRVVETDHTLILDWNERVLDIVDELVEANASLPDAAVVVLAEEEKEEMDDAVATRVKDLKTTRVVTRNGNPANVDNLEKIGAAEARSAIILASCRVEASEEKKGASDAKVVKTLLALRRTRNPDRPLTIVAELFGRDYRDLVNRIDPENVTSIDAWEILGKLIVQTSRTSGLSVVYKEALSFHGSEFYRFEADWTGLAFHEIADRMPDGIPVAIRKADGRIEVLPPDGTVMEEGDSAYILAEDDSTLRFLPEPIIRPREHPASTRRGEQSRERELILGWHSVADVIIREYTQYVLEGSEIDIVLAAPPPKVRSRLAEIEAENTKIRFRLIEKNPLNLKDLASLDPASYDNVIILSQSGDRGSAEETDADTLIVLLLLRGILEDEGGRAGKTKIITQILNSSNQNLVEHSRSDDFIISNKFITMILAQISENPEIKRFYDEIFEEEGAEIYLKPLEWYFDPLPGPVPFTDLMLAARRRNEICLGYRKVSEAEDLTRNFGVRLVPAKDEVIDLGPEDRLVVLAEDEL